MARRIPSSLPSLLLLAMAPIIACAAEAPRDQPAAPASSFERIHVVGEKHASGIFDPSIEYGPDGVGWMSYSRVRLPEYVDTHLATSTDGGKTWRYVATINESVRDPAALAGKEAYWRYETSTLVYDPGDRAERRWKLFVERYPTVRPHKPKHNLHGNGWIEYKYAAEPDGRWSEAIRLFGRKTDGCRVDLNALHPDLKGMKFYNELGSLVADGVIYISMDASPTGTGLGDWKARKVILIASADHGSAWQYVGTLTDYRDAQALGYLVLTGSSLARVGKRRFLFATPAGGGLFKKMNRHNGTLVIEFADVAAAKLQRDGNGQLIVAKRIEPPLTSGGQADYDEQNTYGGIVFPQIDAGERPEFFQIFSTHQGIARDPAEVKPQTR